MYLIEIYKSVQGESSFAGLPCIFVRLAGCNLRCAWCDSEYTFKGGYRQTQDEVEEAVAALAPGAAGGVYWRRANAAGARAGAVDGAAAGDGLHADDRDQRRAAARDVPKDVHKIVDVKCPGSGEGGTFRMENLETLTKRDEMKFVISDRTDYEFARDFALEHRLRSSRGGAVFAGI